MKHSGIDMIENLRTRGDRDDNQIASRLRTEKAALNIAMEHTAQDNPAKLKPDDIKMLRGYEVALAYIAIEDLTNKTAIARLKNAIDGYNATGQPNDSLRYEARLKDAVKPPTSRLSVTFDL